MVERAPEEVIARRAERRLAKPEKAFITPLPISGFCDNPTPEAPFFRFIFPMDCLVTSLSICLVGEGFKTTPVEVKVGWAMQRIFMLKAEPGIPAVAGFTFAVNEGDLLSVRLTEAVKVSFAFVTGRYEMDAKYLGRLTVSEVAK